MTSSSAVETRARQSLGTSGEAIYALVESVIAERHRGGGVLADIGCGTGILWRRLHQRFDRCRGVDAVRYEGLDGGIQFTAHDLDQPGIPLPDGCANVVVAVETIEHLENPWAFLRELTRLAASGAWVVVTTPNQLSLLSKLTLVLKQSFNAFQDASYPAHRTALLEIDLRRIAAEAGLGEIQVRYTLEGRLPFTGAHYPRAVSRWFPRGCSDNVLIVARKLPVAELDGAAGKAGAGR
jgi:2-polyprenyl-3-methyl-5-hydroxy-6-metoxy-1,4-benzoquinol methylase